MFILGFGDSMVEGAAPEECSFLKSFPFSHSLLFSLLLLPAKCLSCLSLNTTSDMKLITFLVSFYQSVIGQLQLLKI